MNKNNNWIMLAIVCGIIAYAYMQQKKPALVFPLPSFKESFEDIEQEKMRQEKMKQQAIREEKRIKGIVDADPEAQLALLHARIFGLENPRYQNAIGELVRSQVPASQLQLADVNAKKYKEGLIKALEGRGIKYIPRHILMEMRKKKALGKMKMMNKPPMTPRPPPMAKQVVVANGQAFGGQAF